MNSKRVLAGVSILFVVALLAACGGGSGGGSTTPALINVTPTTTAIGTASGVAASATIGATGGSVATPDGKITLTIPAGALAANTLIGIQPITNTAHGGLDAGYRLTPDGQTFAQPVALKFAYTAQDLAGSDPAILGAAYQTSTGYWKWLGTPTTDSIAKTMTISTTHFTDFSMVQGYRLQPLSKTLKVNDSLSLQVVYCYPPPVAPSDDLTPLGLPCSAPAAQGGLAPLVYVSDWSVNGVAGGNGTTGTVSGNGLGATYTAPATKPAPNIVAASARVNLGSGAKVLVASNITITDLVPGYTGTVNFTTTVTTSGVNTSNGVANVTWVQTENLPDVKTYTASGTISGSLAPVLAGFTCTPLPVTSTILSTDKLLVYTASNTLWPSTHAFTVTAADTNTILTTNCTDNSSGSTVPVQFAKLLYAFVGGNCLPGTTPQPVAFTNEAQLSGSYNCPGATNFEGTNASWTFTQQ
ncbi:MAG TPA: hypothetical protein VMV48_06170 [Gallionellaceae bacterium]|nr:hypothetical protein [Gallionellaceae bacterium]